jgi:hypothetical protein
MEGQVFAIHLMGSPFESGIVGLEKLALQLSLRKLEEKGIKLAHLNYIF